MSTFDHLVEAGTALRQIDWDSAPEPFRSVMAAGRKALSRKLADFTTVEANRHDTDLVLFARIGDLDAIDKMLDGLIAGLRDELIQLTSQELAKIMDETGGGVLAITYRSMATETLRSRLG